MVTIGTSGDPYVDETTLSSALVSNTRITVADRMRLQSRVIIPSGTKVEAESFGCGFDLESTEAGLAIAPGRDEAGMPDDSGIRRVCLDSLEFNGLGVAENPIVVGKCNKVTLLHPYIHDAIGHALKLESAQNLIVDDPLIEDCGGAGIWCDWGVGGLVVRDPNMRDCLQGALWFSGEHGYLNGPVKNQNIIVRGGILEMYDDTPDQLVYLGGAKHVWFDSVTLALGRVTGPSALFRFVDEPTSNVPLHIHLRSCEFYGKQTYVTALDVCDWAIVYVEGANVATDLLVGIRKRAHSSIKLVGGEWISARVTTWEELIA